MVQLLPHPLLTLALCALTVCGLCMHYDPQQLHGRVLQKCTHGFLALLVWNLLLPLHLGVNPLSVWIAGTLGLPGLGLLAALSLMA